MRLAPGSIPAHADSCEDYNNIGMPNNAVQVRLAYITAADSTPSSLCRPRHSPVLSGCIAHSVTAASTVVALAEAVQAKAWIVLELQGRLKRANIECVVLEVFTFPM